MKKLVVMTAIFALAICPLANAGIFSSDEDNNYKLGIDAPSLVKVNDSLHVGLEVTKDMNRVDREEGWEAYFKATVPFTLFDFTAGS